MCGSVVACQSTTTDNAGHEIECIDIKDFICQVTPYVTYIDKLSNKRMSAPESAIVSALQTTANDFARQTHIMQRTFKVKAQLGVADYFIPVPVGEQVHLVQSVCVGRRQLMPNRGVEPCGDPFKRWGVDGTSDIDNGSDWGYSGYGSYGSHFGCCDNQRWMCESFQLLLPDKLILRRYPRRHIDCLDITVNYITVPDFTACTFDRLLYNRHRSAIVAGTVERLLELPGWEWSSPGFGVKAGRDFMTYVNDAKVDMARGYITGMQSAITHTRF